MGESGASASVMVLGHVTAVLLVVSALVRANIPARAIAILAGLGALAYALAGNGNSAIAGWAAVFVAAHAFTLWRTSRSAQAAGPFSPELAYFQKTAVPFLPPERAQILLDIAAEFSTAADSVLIREGDEGHDLYFITEGTVAIETGQRRVATVSAGSFIGEIGLMTGQPATASVVSVSPVKCLAFSRDTLNSLFESDPELHEAVELAFKRALREKLVQANKTVSGTQTASPQPEDGPPFGRSG